jgi:hypothetical protein
MMIYLMGDNARFKHAGLLDIVGFDATNVRRFLTNQNFD